MSIFSNRGLVAFIIGLMTFGTFAVAGQAMAASDSKSNSDENKPSQMMGGAKSMRPIVIGTVSAINGTTFTVTSKMRAKGENEGSASTTPTTTKTYTINAANATITKNNATSTLSAIAVGDTVMIQGTLSGSTITATIIRDGVAKMMGKGPGDKGNGSENKPQNLIIQGNGQPVVGGNVTAVSGTTLTITNKGNVTYTVDATNAVITKGNATSTLSHIAVGDTVIVQGIVNGASIVASSVIDQGVASTGTAATTPEHRGGGFFSAIGGFFSRLFGFF